MVKKIAIALVIALMLSLCACGNTESGNNSGDNSSSSSSSSSTTVAGGKENDKATTDKDSKKKESSTLETIEDDAEHEIVIPFEDTDESNTKDSGKETTTKETTTKEAEEPTSPGSYELPVIPIP